jgi:putative lipoic acid-binding regulatory protein
MDANNSKLKDLLDHHHKWPDTFLFKFIFKTDPLIEKDLSSLFSESSEFVIKNSKKENYKSMTVKHLVSDAQEILEIYKKAGEIEGVLSL